jgi:hypothetical protein
LGGGLPAGAGRAGAQVHADDERDLEAGRGAAGRRAWRGGGPAAVDRDRLPASGPAGPGHQRGPRVGQGAPVDRRAAQGRLRAAAGDAAWRVRDPGHPGAGRVRDGAGHLPVGPGPAHRRPGPVHPLHPRAAGDAGVDPGRGRRRGPLPGRQPDRRATRVAGRGVLALPRRAAAPGVHRAGRRGRRRGWRRSAGRGAGLPAGDAGHRPRQGLCVGARAGGVRPAGDLGAARDPAQAHRQAHHRAVLPDLAGRADPAPARLQGPRHPQPQPGRGGQGVFVPARAGGRDPRMGRAGLPPHPARRAGGGRVAPAGPVTQRGV